MMLDAARGIQYLHSRRIIHRDIKVRCLESILLRRTLYTVLTHDIPMFATVPQLSRRRRLARQGCRLWYQQNSRE
jgi:serine/threonine protein kinase